MSQTIITEQYHSELPIPTTQQELFKYLAQQPEIIVGDIDQTTPPRPWETETFDEAAPQDPLTAASYKIIDFLREPTTIQGLPDEIQPVRGVRETLAQLSRLSNSKSPIMGYLAIDALGKMLTNPNFSTLTSDADTPFTPLEVTLMLSFLMYVVNQSKSTFFADLHMAVLPIQAFLENYSRKNIKTDPAYKPVGAMAAYHREGNLTLLAYYADRTTFDDQMAYTLLIAHENDSESTSELEIYIDLLPPAHQAYLLHNSSLFKKAVELGSWEEALKSIEGIHSSVIGVLNRLTNESHGMQNKRTLREFKEMLPSD